MQKVFWHFFLITLSLLLANGCKKSDNQAVSPNYYAGAGTAGDVLSFVVNESLMNYSVYNESNKLYDNGSFTIYSNELNGLYKVYAQGAFYYAVEIPGMVFTGNFPTARLNSNLSFSISQQANGSNPQIGGNYVYLHISNTSVNGSTLNREWGILTISADGTWTKQGYCNDTGSLPKLMPDEYSGTGPPAYPADSGFWNINPAYPNIFRMSQTNSADILTGFPFASDSGAVFIMDLGYGHGFLAGLKILDGDQNRIKGNYGYADVMYNAATGGGKFAVNDSSYNVEWWRADSYSKVKNGLFGNLSQTAVLKNVYYSKDVVFSGDTVNFYAVTSGPYFIEFQFRNNKFRSYGLGARLP